MKILDLLDKQNVAIAISFLTDNVVGILDGSGLKESFLTRPMGICALTGGLAISFRHGIAYFRDFETEDRSIYRQTYTQHTGFLNGHELVNISGVPVLANTLFNCLSAPSESKDFHRIYQPPFILDSDPGDRIHLNGIAVNNNRIEYFSCFTITPKDSGSWRHETREITGRSSARGDLALTPTKGCVWDVIANKPLITNLSLPHSPRVIGSQVLVCESGLGRILIRDKDKLFVAAQVNSFVRGMIAIDNYLLVGTSKIRPISENNRHHNKNRQLRLKLLTENKCGLVLLKRITPTKYEQCDRLEFADKKEIFDIQVVGSRKQLLTVNSEEFGRVHLL